ncbi:hypothetical protein N7474_004649 [Penicillium riverlandense]|uniref:uncharacterized protein n=1 Tax=Penicillium riverlandense TaxID=1903569 RepID=UPI002547D23F|nr:uncharacterized protein N7474_004649 [Penicillium riverlandense]KAJ5819058.1 hypothetical protein N7474_004649 [Penicillium riverlandense]
MSGFNNIMKEGWHPKSRDGKKESWRGDFKGINQVAGWMGKGKDPDSDRVEHVSQPLSSLRDPSSFAPPPKRSPAGITPDRHGVGAPLSQDQINSQNAHLQQEAEAEEAAAQKPAPPPVPYRVDTTGLSTNNLPPPPVRRLDSPGSGSLSSTASAKPKPPQVPPRLPPRDGPASQTPPRLRHLPLRPEVPALGIGETDGRQSQPVNELQSRFSQMKTNDYNSAGPPPPYQATQQTSSPSESAAGGRSSIQDFRERHADKIDMGKQKLGGVTSRVNTFVEDRQTTRPTSNSSEPAAGGRSSIQDFRERHADKIDMGKQKLGGVTSRFNTFVEDRKFSANANKRIPRPPSNYSSPVESSPSGGGLESAARNKKPPPPPPKKAEIRAPPVASSPSSASPAPPPVPLNSKPR